MDQNTCPSSKVGVGSYRPTHPRAASRSMSASRAAPLAGAISFLLLTSIVVGLGITPGSSPPSIHTAVPARPTSPTGANSTSPPSITIVNTTSLGAGLAPLATIPVGFGPELPAYDPVNGWVYVSNGGEGSDNVSIINGTTVVSTTALGNASPLPAIIDTTNGNAYVALNFSAQMNGTTVYTGAGLAVLNGTSILATISFGTGNLSIGGTFDSWNGCVYETIENETNSSYSIVVINGTSLVGKISAEQGANQPTFDPGNGWLYIPNFYTGTVTVVNGTSANSTSVVANIASGGGAGCGCGDPITATVNLTNGDVYVVNQVDNSNVASVTVLDGSSVVKTINLEVDSDGYCPTAAFWDQVNGYVYVLTSSGCSGYYWSAVNVIAGLSLIGSYFSFPEGHQRLSGTVDPLTGYLFVSEAIGGDNLSVIRNLSLMGNVSLAGEPGPGVFDPANSLLYFPTTSNTSNSITVLNASYVYPTQPFPSISSFTASPSVLVAGSPLRASTTLTVNASGGVGWLTYSYPTLPAGCASVNSSTLVCTPSSPGQPPFYGETVRVDVADSAGSAVTAGFNLTVLPAISTSASVAQTNVDVGETDNFYATASGGLGPVTYSWQFGDGAAANVSNPSHAYSAPGSYVAQVWANDTAGDSSSTAPAVTVAPALSATITVSNTTLSLGQSIEINATASGGRGLYTYLFSGLPPGCVGVNASSIGCLPTQAGYYDPTVTVNDQNGGIASANISVQVVFGFTVLAPSSAVVNQPVTIYVNVAQSAGEVHYTYANLPPGCESEDTPALTCTPTAIGEFAITVAALSPIYGTAQKVVDLRIVGSGGSAGSQGQALLEEAVVGVAIGAAVIAAVVVLIRLQKKRA
jgi:DNA-binding beta-propeller fold protein YncE